jgi:hypothetical protein
MKAICPGTFLAASAPGVDRSQTLRMTNILTSCVTTTSVLDAMAALQPKYGSIYKNTPNSIEFLLKCQYIKGFLHPPWIFLGLV